MKNLSRSAILLISIITATNIANAQTSTVTTMMQTSLNKIRTSSQTGGVIERTFSDIIFKEDTSGTNCIFFHHFSSSNAYRVNAFAPSDQVSQLTVSVFYKENGKWNKVASNNLSGADVSFRFTPQVAGSYAIFVKGTLQTNINNSMFNLIIERD
jgi:hypothetical protein